ncbi:MAG: thiol:disulfide interchange protein [Myxococcota bacterium]|jgi:thiol:disulfide interchange protein
MSFDALVWVVALGSLALSAVFFWAGRMWLFEYSMPAITKVGKVRKAVFGVLMGFALFITLGAFTIMTPPPSFEWQKDHDKGLALAAEQDKPVFVDFWAEWCAACKDIERDVMSTDAFKEALAAYVPIKVDGTDDEDPEVKRLEELYKVQSRYPTFVLRTADGSRQETFVAPKGDPETQTKAFVTALDSFAAGGSVGGEDGKSDFQTALEEGLLWALTLAFFGGLVTSATPCVYPMIPVTVGIIGSVGGGSKKKAFVASLVYVLGMALCFSILGVGAAMLGTGVSALFQSTWFPVAVALMLLFLAAHMLEIRKIGFLSRMNARGGEISNASASNQGLGAVFGMGAASSLVFAPCVGPVLLGVLTYIGQSGDVFLGFIFMFTFAMGLGMPFILLGTFAGLALARPGDWMVGVEAAFGGALVAAALYFLVPVVPALSQVFTHLGALAG